MTKPSTPRPIDALLAAHTAAYTAAYSQDPISEPQMGDTIDITQGRYGHIEPCKFCGADQTEYPALWYNGYGPPPSYAVACGNCGAQGPTSRGRERDDHFGAREDAVRLWNASPKDKP